MTLRCRYPFLAGIAVFAFLAALLLWPADRKPTEEDAKMMDGKWSISSAELAGQPFPAELAEKFTLILEKDKYTVKSPSPDDVGTATIDASKTPKQMDIHGLEGPNQGKTFLAIYELDGDSLRICYDLEGKFRPDEFKTAERTKQFLVLYKRVKE